MDEDLARFAVQYGRNLGVQYCEARFHRTKEIACILKNGLVEPAVIDDAVGLGVRVLHQGALAFSSTNVLDKANIREAVSEALKRARAAKSLLRKKVRFSKEQTTRKKWSAPEKRRIENVGVEKLLAELREIDHVAVKSGGGVKIPNRFHVLSASLEEKVYVNSEGTNLHSRVPRIQYYTYLTAVHGGQTAQRFFIKGETGGWEAYARMKLEEIIKHETKILRLLLTKAVKPPAGKIDVILAPEVSGIAAHESVGHPTEADRIIGREAAQAGESYLKPENVGMKIGSDQAYLSDDPTLPNSFGFYLFDDEGVAARKRALIQAGYIKELLHNRSTAYDFGLRSNASSRAVRFDREPIVRMGNTFVEPGDHTLDELLDDVEQGIYMKSFMEWNIDDKRLNQRYTGFEAYLIEKGELKGLVKGPVLEITTPGLWGSVDARGKEMGFFAGTCGKGEPMQGCPVWMGGPDVRLRKVTIGVRQ